MLKCRHIACVLLVSAVAASAARADVDANRAADAIAELLRLGRVEQAAIIAVDADRDYPDDAGVALRAGQAHLRRALELNRDLERFAEDLDLVSVMGFGERILASVAERTPTTPDQQRAMADLVAAYPRLKAEVEEQAAGSILRAGELGPHVVAALKRALAALERIAATDDASTEARLSLLWARAITISIQQRWVSLSLPDSAWLAELRNLRGFYKDAAPPLYRAAQALAEERPRDPVAIAGAADVIAFLAVALEVREPLAEHARMVLDHRVMRDPAGAIRDMAPDTRARFREQFREAIDGPAPDPAAAPQRAATRLYLAALEADPRRSVERLPMRVYLLLAAFDDERAERSLTEMERRHPDDAAPHLERARRALMLDGDVDAGAAHLRAALGKRRLIRSDLVAAPDLLRASLRFAPPLMKQLARRQRLGYQFVHNLAFQRNQDGDASLIPVALRLLDLLMNAEDFHDQSEAISARGGLIGFLASRAGGLPAERRAVYERLLADHERRTAGRPSGAILLEVSIVGVIRNPRRPEDPRRADIPGYTLMLVPPSFGMFRYNARIDPYPGVGN